MHLHRRAVLKGLKEAFSPGSRSVWISRLVEESFRGKAEGSEGEDHERTMGLEPGVSQRLNSGSKKRV